MQLDSPKKKTPSKKKSSKLPSWARGRPQRERPQREDVHADEVWHNGMTVLPEEECLGAFVDLQQKRRPPRREIDFDPGMMMMRMFQPENGRDGFGQLAVPANGTVLPQPATMAVLIDRECQLRLDPGTLAAFKDLSIDDARVIESVQLTAGAEFGLGPEVLDVIRCAQLLAPACRAVKQAHYVKFNRTTQGTLQQGDPVPTMRLGRIRQRTRCRPAGRRARLCGGPSRCSIRRQPRTKGSRAAGRRLGRRAARGGWRGVAAAADREHEPSIVIAGSQAPPLTSHHPPVQGSQNRSLWQKWSSRPSSTQAWCVVHSGSSCHPIRVSRELGAPTRKKKQEKRRRRCRRHGRCGLQQGVRLDVVERSRVEAWLCS